MQKFEIWGNCSVTLEEITGSDLSIVAAARVIKPEEQERPSIEEIEENRENYYFQEQYIPYSKGLRKDVKLLNYMLSNGHTSPFEMASIRVRMDLPLFVARQIVRHRTSRFCHFNEMSGRYSEFSETFMPDTFRKQSDSRKQGGDEEVSPELNSDLFELVQGGYSASNEIYEKMIRAGVSLEQARMVLPVASMTQLIMQVDLNNLMHFLELRTAPDAQLETRWYANCIEQIFKENFPYTYKIWKEINK